MSLNLNLPADFAKLTLSTASSALTQLSGLAADAWDIEEGSYGHAPKPPILFHIFKSSPGYEAGLDQVQDKQGRRKPVFEFPYVDGQFTDDLGRRGAEFDLSVLFHGPKYRLGLDAFLAELNDPRPGTLVHPVFGRLPVVPLDWQITHQSASRLAASVSVRFAEHTFDISFTKETAKVSSVKTAISAALAIISKVSSAVARVESIINLAVQTKGFIVAAVNEYSALFTKNLSQMNQAFNGGSSVDLPGLLPVNDGTDSFTTALAPNDPFAGVVVSESTTAALAAQQAIDQVKALRQKTIDTIAAYQSAPDGDFVFFQEILDLKSSAIEMQKVLELGIASSNATLLSYVAPMEMSIREVAFANGLNPDRSVEIEQLNPSLLSVNLIPAGTIVKVPSA